LVTAVSSGTPWAFQSGISSAMPLGSITAPERMCAPDLGALLQHRHGDVGVICFSRIAAASPDGPAPTITTSYSIASRSTASLIRVPSLSDPRHGVDPSRVLSECHLAAVKQNGGKPMRWVVVAGVLALMAVPASAATRWIGSWGASPAPPMTAAPNGAPNELRRLSPSFNNQTVAQVVRLSAGGPRLRIRFTNEYGTKPLALGAARVALLGPDGAVVPGSERTVTFAGAASTTVPPGAPMLSDPVALPTRALARLRISLFLPAETGLCTCHANGNEAPRVADGDATGRDIPPGPPADYRAFLSGVEVEAAQPARVIVAFGDSITDGARSTQGKNARWPDRLAERLAAKYPGRPIGVVNAGIGGNRVLSETAITMFGQSALTRFDRDVLSVPGVHRRRRAGRRQRPGRPRRSPLGGRTDRRVSPADRARARPRRADHRRDHPALRRRGLLHAPRARRSASRSTRGSASPATSTPSSTWTRRSATRPSPRR
jgi:hypothetical protein